MRVSHNPLVKLIVKLRMFYCDIRGHHGKKWNYEPSEHYMGMGKKRRSQLCGHIQKKKTILLANST